jgi:hypothetical protein
MGFGRILAVAGVAAAGAAWFKRRRAGSIEGEHHGATGADGATPAEMRDPVDQAIAESFPASDPPSFAGNPKRQ